MTGPDGRGGHEVVRTGTGAAAIRDRASGEVMHPGVGPWVESRELYLGPSRLAARLAEPGPDPLVLFDVGLGAGSNARAARAVAEALAAPARRLELVSFEHDLGALALALEPAHAAEFGLTGEAGAAARALLAGGRHETARTCWRLVPGDLVEGLGREPPGRAEIVFWDPFSPRVDPAPWSLRAFAALRRASGDRATVHTYSGATAVRAALLLAGFAVGVGPAIGRKSETTSAASRVEDLAHPLDRRWLERLARSPVPFPADGPPDALARIRAAPQFRSGPPGP